VNNSVYSKVIRAIHSNWMDSEPFSLKMVGVEACVSKSSVIRILRTLMQIQFITHTKKAFAGRHYRVTIYFPTDVEDAIKAYELSQILKVPS